MRHKRWIVQVDFSNEFSRTTARNCLHWIKLFTRETWLQILIND
jgi:hypothetical protein